MTTNDRIGESAPPLSVDFWCSTIDRDYLQSYLPEGGSAVKVVVGSAAGRAAVAASLAERSRSRNFIYAHVDAGVRRVHLIHPLVNDVCAQIPWERLAARVVENVLREKDYRIPTSGELSVEALAEANNIAKSEIVQPLRAAISNRVFKNYALSREFRSAASSLCRAVYDRTPQIVQEAADARAWLDGTVPGMTLLRQIGIFRKIGRANARQVLYSAAEWINAIGEPGLVVTIDASRYVLGKDVEPGAFPAYTKLAELDYSEVLRQFIDATDELKGTLLVFLTDERFVQEQKRGLRAYDALRLRLTDDVRDRARANPLAPMVIVGVGA